MARAVLIVLDSVGIGELPDAAEFGDEGTNTIRHVDEYRGGLNIPNMKRLGKRLKQARQRIRRTGILR